MPSTHARPANTSRRAVLAGVVGVAASLAGCLAGDDAAGDDAAGGDSPNEPSSTDATSTTFPPCPDDLDRPRDENGPEYPSLPSDDSGAVAMNFALGFEESLQRNRIRLLEGPVTFLEVVDSEATDPTAVEDGTLVGVRLAFEYGFREHTSTAEVTVDPFEMERTVHASYLVSETRALRLGTDELIRTDPRDSPDGSVVACAA